MYTVQIRKSLKAGWDAFARRPWYLMGLAGSFTILFFMSLGNAVVTALAYIIYSGYLGLMLKHFRGTTVKFDDVFSIDNRWISFAFLGLIKGLLIMLGFICLVVPGIYLAIRWMFAEMLIIDKGMRPMEALAASSRMVKTHYWKLVLFILSITALFVIGTLLFVVGLVPVTVIALFSSIALYERLKGVLDEPVPTTETAPTA